MNTIQNQPMAAKPAPSGLFNTQMFHIVAAFLVGIASMLSQQLRNDLSAGNCNLDDQVMELKVEVAGGGTIDLIDGTTERIDGVCSFDKDRLMQGRAFVFDELALGYATNAASGLAGNIAYNTVAPKELQNAVLIIAQEGREVLRIPVRDIHNIYTSQQESQEYHALKSLRFLADNRAITIQLKFPPTVALSGAAKHYVYLRLSGLQTSKKTNS